MQNGVYRYVLETCMCMRMRMCTYVYGGRMWVSAYVCDLNQGS